MASPTIDKGRCLRYKSDLQKKPLLQPTSTISVDEHRQSSLSIWISVSLLLLFILYLIYRRRQNKFDEEQENNEHERQILEDNIYTHESSEYRLSVGPSLPTIVEENQVILNPPIDLNHHITSTNITSRNLLEDNDSNHTSSTVLRQRKTPKNDVDDIDDYVQIPPIIEEKPYYISKDSTKVATELPSTIYETGHPVIFRKFCIPHENAIKDDFTSIEEINQAVKDVGLVRSQLIFGIDYTISNLETGKHSFNGLSLHHIQEGLLNPYQSVITIVGRTLEKFDSDTLIPAFGFGDRTTVDRKIFPLRPDGSYCKGFRGVLEAYNKITPKVRMAGPTNFAPLIKEAIRIVKKTGQYHILVIVADGQVTNERQTKEAIVEASNYPLSIVMIGVGDGPWDMMKEFDDSLPARQFDNFQFVNYNSVVEASIDTDADFALHALMEIPSQYAAIKRLGLLKEKTFS
ncbi:unnamed protein product [Rotaria sp. Silwood1]|nr:unnamed protein product [Rotaria sp. Silwood1]CAF3788076.1 unnamed protein product [Rotaria sp. Silwood1]CAF3862721.1 unnamed protein product [Rotaria sp. Silwood1]CAF4832909.1 unnamed protein product [Rotaria sp. Silwood1]CAF4850768.1 unnamed protein product [Rotaria sp. Silwood1]